MNELTHREKRELVTELYIRYVEDDELIFRTMASIKNFADRVDALARMIVKYLPQEFAVYGGVPHIFNGCYYEPVTYEQIKYGVEEFLYQKKVPASDRNEKAMYCYMKRIEERIKEHELKPRLSLMCFLNCVVDMNTLKCYPFGVEHDVVKQYKFKYDKKRRQYGRSY